MSKAISRFWYRRSVSERGARFHFIGENQRALCGATFVNGERHTAHGNDEHSENCRACLTTKTNAAIAAAIREFSSARSGWNGRPARSAEAARLAHRFRKAEPQFANGESES